MKNLFKNIFLFLFLSLNCISKDYVLYNEAQGIYENSENQAKIILFQNGVIGFYWVSNKHEFAKHTGKSITYPYYITKLPEDYYSLSVLASDAKSGYFNLRISKDLETIICSNQFDKKELVFKRIQR